MKTNRLLAGWWVIILVAALSGGCASQPAVSPEVPKMAEPSKPTPAAPKTASSRLVRLQVPTAGASMLQFDLGKEKGVFKSEGIDLETIMLKATLVTAALMSGEVDYSAQGTGPFEAGLQGLPIRQIMGIRTKPHWRVFSAEGINSVADLKGKSVAVGSIGAAAHYVTKESLGALGLDPDKDVTFVAVPSGGPSFAALKSKAVGAAALTPPFDAQARKEGYKELVDTGDVLELPMNGLGTLERKIKDEPEWVKKMMRATLKSMAYLRDHPQEAMDYMIKNYDVGRDVAKESYDDLVKRLSADGSISDKGLQLALKMAQDQGSVKGSPALEKGIDFTLLKEVQKELGLSR